MSNSNRKPQMDAPVVESRWKDLYRWGGISSAAGIAAIALGVVAFIIWPYSPNAVSTAEVYAQVLTDRIGALMGLDLLYLVGNLFAIPLVLAMYVALRKVNESYALIAMVLGIMGLLLLLAARPILEVVTLADRYAAATTDAERTILLAAGEPLLLLFTGTSYYVSYLIGTLSLLIYAFLMLEGKIFSKATAWVGIVTNVVAFGMFIPVVGLPLAFLSLAGLVVWNIQLARRFFQLARMASREPASA
ncbi:MAG: DUF4386 family protein [Anaerolineales bacterium]